MTAMNYLGSVPVTDIGEKFTQAAVELLTMKLQRLQKKMVDKVVEKKFGSRLSEASPVYQKMYKKLSTSVRDCTRGDAVMFAISGENLTLTDTKSSNSTTIPLCDILSLTLLPPRSGETMVYFSFIQEEGQDQLVCHVLTAAPDIAEYSRKSLSHAVREVAAKSQQKKGVLGKASGLSRGADKNTITFGVGLNKKSSIRVSDGLKRKGTVNLKGKSGGEVKRRSSSYGNTFASLSRMAPAGAAAIAEASETEIAAMKAIDEDEDLLDCIDDDIFGQVDELQDEGEETARVAADGDDVDLDLSQFGFGDGIDDDDDDDGC